MKKNKILLSILFAFLLIVIPSKALALTNLTQEDFDEVNEEKGLTYHELEDTPGYLKLESGEYVLDEDIMLPTYIIVDEENEVTFDLNGKKIFNSNANETLVFGVDGKLTLTGKGIVGKKITSITDSLNMVIDTYHGEIIIDDITANGEIVSHFGKLTINNGTFNDVVGAMSKTKLVVNDGTFNGLYLEGNVDVTINGGKFNKGVRSFGLGIEIDEEDDLTEEEVKELTSAPAVMYSGMMIGPVPIGDDDEEQVANKLVINGGEFEGGNTALNIWGMDSVAINGGTFTAYVDAVVIMADNVKIAGGLFKISENALFNKYNEGALRTALGLRSENVELSGGKFVGDESGYSIVIEGEDEKVFEDALVEGYIYSDEISAKEYVYEDEEIPEDTPAVWYLENQEILVIPEEGEYEILDGANQEVKSGSNLMVRASGDISLFVKLLIDDKEVARDNYELTEGSTIITLNSSFLANLSSGKHTMTFVYKNGEVKTSFTINNEKNPATGDNVLLYVGLLGLSVISLLGYRLVRKAN